MTENTKDFHVLGPPGTGKTTYLSKQIRSAADKHGDQGVLVVSFTRAAAAEIAARVGLQPDDTGSRQYRGGSYTWDPDGGSQGDSGAQSRRQIGTLHAICYHQLDRPEIAETHATDWNEQARPDMRITGQGGSKTDEPEWSGNTKGGDRVFMKVQQLRARQVPPELWPGTAARFYRAWCDWKLDRGLLDFTDLIEVVIKRDLPPPAGVKVGIVDEAQDFTRLELSLISRWTQQLETTVLAYDDDQCQPASTRISITGGRQIPLGLLDPQQHRVVSFDRSDGGKFQGREKGFAFEVTSRSYTGRMLRLTSNGKMTWCTPNHRWFVRWSEIALDCYCVYLMRRGPWWRVGWCKLICNDGILNLAQRSRFERADAAWILATFPKRGHAVMYRALIATRNAIPSMQFKKHDKNHYTPEQITWFFDELAQNDAMTTSAKKCLIDHGRELEHPIWMPGLRKTQHGSLDGMELRASNLLPEAMLIPSDVGKTEAAWHSFTVEAEPGFNGKVWSLKVEPHELYVADGLLTHNSLYTFKGAVAEELTSRLPPKDRIRILSQSYRVPRAVHALANRWVHKISNRVEKAYEPRDFEGEVTYLDEATSQCPNQMIEAVEADLTAGRSVMILAACGYMLRKTIGQLRTRGLPFHNPYSSRRGDWNPLKRNKGAVPVRLEAYLKRNPDFAPSEGEALFHLWTAHELYLIIEHLNADVLAYRGAKTVLKQLASDKDTKDQFVEEADFVKAEVMSWFGTGQLNPYLENLLGSKRTAFDYAAAIARRDIAGLIDDPRITIGTIHSAKGSESDSVYLFPDLSVEGAQQWRPSAKGRDDIRRLFYVGFTRARERLTLCKNVGEAAVQWSA